MLTYSKEKMPWYMNVSRSNCVVIENVSFDMWWPTLGYLKYVSGSSGAYIDGVKC